MWKERLWQVFLVIILGFVLTMCNRSATNNKSSNSGTLNADGTTTVIVSSLPTITLANAGPSAISHTMLVERAIHLRIEPSVPVGVTCIVNFNRKVEFSRK